MKVLGISSTIVLVQVGHRNIIAFGKEPRVIFLKKFDGTNPNFKNSSTRYNFFNKDQPLSYPTKEIKVKSIKILFSRQCFNYFVSIYEKTRSDIGELKDLFNKI